ncbi:hypothetical protein F5Y13DRAFT_59072 [Hypoxylon sp. FL1857]|nr:hypothetical protein F5Y13DRAFT_59072 [Hypoxylon sp. FL1857]
MAMPPEASITFEFLLLFAFIHYFASPYSSPFSFHAGVSGIVGWTQTATTMVSTSLRWFRVSCHKGV